MGDQCWISCLVDSCYISFFLSLFMFCFIACTEKKLHKVTETTMTIHDLFIPCPWAGWMNSHKYPVLLTPISFFLFCFIFISSLWNAYSKAYSSLLSPLKGKQMSIMYSSVQGRELKPVLNPSDQKKAKFIVTLPWCYINQKAGFRKISKV